jgi:predicted Zn-dependent protease
LKIVPLPAGGFAQLAKQAPAQLPNAEAQLRLLNGVYPDGEIKPGTLVKTVE